MAKKEDFTDEQWKLLLDVPPAVGTAVMYAGRSGLGSVAEAMAMASEIFAARNGYEGIALIQSLSDARTKGREKSEIETIKSPYRNLSDSEILTDAVEKCRRVSGLLAEKSSSDEANAYIDWTISVAERVANAAKEGGFLGIGGKRVSEEEANVLAQIKEALHASA